MVEHRDGTARDHKGPADEEGGVASGHIIFFLLRWVGWLTGWVSFGCRVKAGGQRVANDGGDGMVGRSKMTK